MTTSGGIRRSYSAYRMVGMLEKWLTLTILDTETVMRYGSGRAHGFEFTAGVLDRILGVVERESPLTRSRPPPSTGSSLASAPPYPASFSHCIITLLDVAQVVHAIYATTPVLEYPMLRVSARRANSGSHLVESIRDYLPSWEHRRTGACLTEVSTRLYSFPSRGPASCRSHTMM